MKNQIEKILDDMISNQKEKKSKTFVARYKGKNLKMGSGKSSWKQTGHAKNAILCHFSRIESDFVYYQNGRFDDNGFYIKPDSNGAEKRREEFRKKLFELIEIVELKD